MRNAKGSKTTVTINGKNRRYTVNAYVTCAVTLEVTATTPEQAEQLAQDALTNAEIDNRGISGEWEDTATGTTKRVRLTSGGDGSPESNVDGLTLEVDEVGEGQSEGRVWGKSPRNRPAAKLVAKLDPTAPGLAMRVAQAVLDDKVSNDNAIEFWESVYPMGNDELPSDVIATGFIRGVQCALPAKVWREIGLIHTLGRTPAELAAMAA